MKGGYLQTVAAQQMAEKEKTYIVRAMRRKFGIQSEPAPRRRCCHYAGRTDCMQGHRGQCMLGSTPWRSGGGTLAESYWELCTASSLGQT